IGDTESPVPALRRVLPRALPTLSGVEIEGIVDGRTSVDRTRAFIKVQDGCSFFCTYCIIPAARGPERSLSPETVLGDVRRALRAGHREIVLTGINVGTYDGGWSERGFRGHRRPGPRGDPRSRGPRRHHRRLPDRRRRVVRALARVRPVARSRGPPRVPLLRPTGDRRRPDARPGRRADEEAPRRRAPRA